ncbi:MAG: hypothetical protein AAB875_01300 [Patescibacteria group bacterium]
MTEPILEEATVKPVEEVKEPPAEAATVEKPAEAATQVVATEQDVDVLEKQLTGLQQEKDKLLEEVKHLRGSRRELKEQQLVKVQQDIITTTDELSDVNPDDKHLIERVTERLLRQKGIVTKQETQQMYYESVKQQVVAEFLEKYPEYKPENDSQDVNWNSLQRELADYRMPESPHEIRRVLEKAHKAISPNVPDTSIAVKKRTVETASAGAGGTQRSSSGKTLSFEQRRRYEDGGWSKDEIKEIESKL